MCVRARASVRAVRCFSLGEEHFKGVREEGVEGNIGTLEGARTRRMEKIT